MALLEWSDEKLAINVDIIDRQHKKLVGMVNDLHDAIETNHGTNIVGELLVKLFNYTYYHFETEEEWFKRHKYPDCAAHKSEHDLFRAEVAKLDEGCKMRDQLPAKVMALLENWLFNHILKSDRRFGVYLNERA